MAAVRGIGVAVMTSTSGTAPSRPFARNIAALLDAEAVLLVDDDDAERPQLDAFLDERVRADEDVDRPIREARGDATALGRGGAVREQLDAKRSITRERRVVWHLEVR